VTTCYVSTENIYLGETCAPNHLAGLAFLDFARRLAVELWPAIVVEVPSEIDGTCLHVGEAKLVDETRHTRSFGTMKARMGATHFLTKTLPKVATEMALSVLAYNLTRVMNIVGVKPLIAAIGA